MPLRRYAIDVIGEKTVGILGDIAIKVIASDFCRCAIEEIGIVHNQVIGFVS